MYVSTTKRTRTNSFDPHLSLSVGFGTLQCRLPWFHRAVPSATLDKGVLNFRSYSNSSLQFVKGFSPVFRRKKSLFSIVQKLYMTFTANTGIMLNIVL